MQNIAEQIASIIEQQIQNYQALKKLVLEERKALIANDLKALADTTASIRSLVASNNHLETERLELIGAAAKSLEIPNGRPTLLDIAAKLGGLRSERLLKLRRAASDAITDVQRQARINEEMMKYSANLLDSVLKHLVEPHPREATYSSTGRTTRPGAQAALLDHHV
jgi:flagellar biosynthesis/type III secretory pathway chaperone